jgi:hypothetical protein
LVNSNDGGFTITETGGSITYAISSTNLGPTYHANQTIHLVAATTTPSAAKGLTFTYTAGGNGRITDNTGNPMATNAVGKTRAPWATSFDPSDPTTVFTVDGGDPSATTLLTATTDVVTATTSANGDVEVIIPTGTEISDSNGDPFDATAIDTSDAAGSIIASTLGSGAVVQGAVDFGITGTTFYFSVPVIIRIPVDVNDGTTLNIKRSSDGGATWTSDGFTAALTDTCTAGEGSNPVTTSVVSGGYITIYTCRASIFATYSTAPSGGRKNPVVTYYSYGSGYQPGAATSTPASTSTAPSVSVAELQQQINSLIAQLNALILQAKAKGLNVSAAAQALAGTIPSFIRDLEYGMTGEDVKGLQVYLNTHGFAVASSGPGSLGNETTMFGPATRAALIKFQQANSISPALGYFGPKTRAYVASHL